MNRRAPGWLGDSIWRDYGRKLELWNAFAEPELRPLVTALLPSRSVPVRVLDAGCGTGQAARWLREGLPRSGQVVAFDLAHPHAARARTRTSGVLQADVEAPPFPLGSFDLVWSCNTLHHVADPDAVLVEILGVLRPGGQLAVGHSSYLPDMLFAWDSRLERLANEAVRSYYRDRLGRSESELSGIRAWTGRIRKAGYAGVSAHTIVLERTAPLDPSSRSYIQECLFDGTFRGRLEPYLSADDWAELERLMDPSSPAWALGRPDFHFLQTFTVTTGRNGECE